MGLVLDEIDLAYAAASDEHYVCNHDIPGPVEPTKFVPRLIESFLHAAKGLSYLRHPATRTGLDRLNGIDVLRVRMHPGEELLWLLVEPAILICPPDRFHVLLRHRPDNISRSGDWRFHAKRRF